MHRRILLPLSYQIATAVRADLVRLQAQSPLAGRPAPEGVSRAVAKIGSSRPNSRTPA
jgi:hypothetical protein